MLLQLPTLHRSLFLLFLSSPTASLSFLFFPSCTLVVSLARSIVQNPTFVSLLPDRGRITS